MELTAEQEAVRNAKATNVAVLAYAGTGKTSTLVEWAKAHPRERTLYLAFNRSVKEEAARRFPPHVTSLTSHALAFATTGRPYRHKLTGSLRAFTIIKALGFNWVPYRQRLYHVKLALETLSAFFASSAETITVDLVPKNPEFAHLSNMLNVSQVARDANTIWKHMRDPSDPSVSMVHDGYLKLFVMGRPHLQFDTILFDEAQDANPVTIQLVENQTGSRRLWVGDPWQAIYGFRGAVNAMDQVTAHQTFRLTGSFRFGRAIASAATELLRWRDTSTPELRGLSNALGTIRVANPSQRPYTFLARTNARLFAEAVAILTKSPTANLGFVGGIDGYRFDLIEDVYRLWANEPVNDAFLKLIGSFHALETYAGAVGDTEYILRCRLVKDWGHAIPQWIKRIQAAAVPVEHANVALATAHKAKGLEWSVVQIADDFPDLEKDRANWEAWIQAVPGREKSRLADKLLPQEELNLLYVAATRARSELYLPPHLGILIQA